MNLYIFKKVGPQSFISGLWDVLDIVFLQCMFKYKPEFHCVKIVFLSGKGRGCAREKVREKNGYAPNKISFPCPVNSTRTSLAI